MSTDYYLKTLHGMHGMVMLLGRILAPFNPHMHASYFQGSGREANIFLTHAPLSKYPIGLWVLVRCHEACMYPSTRFKIDSSDLGCLEGTRDWD